MPLGSPDEPEVYMTYATCSGWHGAAARGAASPGAGSVAPGSVDSRIIGTGGSAARSWPEEAASTRSRTAPDCRVTAR